LIALKIIGRIILIIIGSVFALALLIISIPFVILGLIIAALLLAVRVTLSLDAGEGDTRFRLKWGFLKIRIYPELFEPARVEKFRRILEPIIYWIKIRVQRFTEKRREKQKEKAPLDLEEIWEKIKAWDFEGAYAKLQSFFNRLGRGEGITELLKYTASKTTGMFGKILNRIIIKELFVGLTVSGDDAASTAMNYGAASAAVFPAMGAICAKMKVRKYDIDLNADFLARRNSGHIHTAIAFRPLLLLFVLIGYAIKVSGKFIFAFLFPKKSKIVENNDDQNKDDVYENKIKIGGALS
jgi:hypothetical protein